jgi:peptide chain release factor
MKRLLLSSGRGPAECRIALRKLVGVLEQEALSSGLDIDLAEGPKPDKYGPVSIVAVLYGETSESFARGWIGSVQWIAQSPIRPHHKRKNWFVGVFDIPHTEDMLPALDLADVRFEAFRAGGPGGQHQNKTESAVRAIHVPTGLSASARDERSQHRNKALALTRLASLIKLQEDIAVLMERQLIHESHNRLERGRPIRRFRGAEFYPA